MVLLKTHRGLLSADNLASLLCSATALTCFNLNNIVGINFVNKCQQMWRNFRIYCLQHKKITHLLMTKILEWEECAKWQKTKKKIVSRQQVQNFSTAFQNQSVFEFVLKSLRDNFDSTVPSNEPDGKGGVIFLDPTSC